MSYCQCEHRVNQARIARIFGSEATCLQCGKPIAPEPDDDDEPDADEPTVAEGQTP